MAQYFVRRGEKVFGPVPGEQVVGLAKSGKVRATDEIATDSKGPWQPTTAMAPLRAVFQQTSAGPLGPATADPLGIGPQHETAEEAGDDVPLGKSHFDMGRDSKERERLEESGADEGKLTVAKSAGFINSLMDIIRLLDFLNLFGGSDD